MWRIHQGNHFSNSNITTKIQNLFLYCWRIPWRSSFTKKNHSGWSRETVPLTPLSLSFLSTILISESNLLYFLSTVFNVSLSVSLFYSYFLKSYLHFIFAVLFILCRYFSNYFSTFTFLLFYRLFWIHSDESVFKFFLLPLFHLART